MSRVFIGTGKPYDVIIEKGALSRTGELVAEIHKPCRAALITETTVAPLYAEAVVRSLEGAGFAVSQFVFPAGEEQKNLATFGRILSFMASEGLTRSDIAIALGGGVTGDITGFSAACYERGIPFVQIPTTLLSMVDASVGGKTAVDLPEGKNLAGAFHQPSLVICDLACLDTLPQGRIADGAAEMIKHGFIADAGLFSDMSRLDLIPNAEALVTRNVEIKRSFVVGDERDSGKRQILNFGHTIGHAVEKLSDYTLSHGQAVAIGMVAALRGCTRAGIGNVPPEVLLPVLLRYGLPSRCPYSAEEVFSVAMADKKRTENSINFIALREIGSPEIKRMDTGDFRSFLSLALSED